MRRRLRELVQRLPREEGGNAVIEFIGMSVLFLVPLVYLTLTFFTIQGAAFAAEGAAREAGSGVTTKERQWSTKSFS